MAKLKLLLVILICLVAIISTFLYLFIGINPLQIPQGLITETKMQRQIQIQLKEASERQKTPPTVSQIHEMQSNLKLCFNNDDCRGNPRILVDCNASAKNKFYICKTSLDNGCFNSAIGCPATDYSTCENNICTKHSI